MICFCFHWWINWNCSWTSLPVAAYGSEGSPFGQRHHHLSEIPQQFATFLWRRYLVCQTSVAIISGAGFLFLFRSRPSTGIVSWLEILPRPALPFPTRSLGILSRLWILFLSFLFLISYFLEDFFEILFGIPKRLHWNSSENRDHLEFFSPPFSLIPFEFF